MARGCCVTTSGDWRRGRRPLPLDPEVSDGQPRMPPQHAWARMAHHVFHRRALGGAVAVDAALPARGLLGA
ncbi:MAG TPA: hypothetical protein VES67_04160, partial [Vicinamibacterales bacterium]|nr:hypothetical protein [Vicinamibacterales bacterium]